MTTADSLPALVARTIFGFTLGCLGVLTFIWLSSLATTADGVPSTLLLARQRSDREVRFRDFVFSLRSISLSLLAGHELTLSTSEQQKNEKTTTHIQLSRVRVREGTSSESSGWGDGCSDPSKWILWGKDWSDLEGGGPPGGICKPQPQAASSGSGSSSSSKGNADCASTIGAPKVALMFLTAGSLPHAEAWVR